MQGKSLLFTDEVPVGTRTTPENLLTPSWRVTFGGTYGVEDALDHAAAIARIGLNMETGNSLSGSYISVRLDEHKSEGVDIQVIPFAMSVDLTRKPSQGVTIFREVTGINGRCYYIAVKPARAIGDRPQIVGLYVASNVLTPEQALALFQSESA